MERSRLAIIIPALNEAATIGPLVRAASSFGVPWVVDDGSNDTTAQVAREAGAQVVQHAINQGYDKALNTGFAAAYQSGCDAFITLDADGQHDPALLGLMLRLLDEGADVVIGIRSRRERLAEHLFAWLTSLIYGIRDPLCGMKAYRSSVYEQLGHFDANRSIGTELALFAARRRMRVVQVPFQVRERADAPRFGRVWLGNLRILRALWLFVFQYLIIRDVGDR